MHFRLASQGKALGPCLRKRIAMGRRPDESHREASSCTMKQLSRGIGMRLLARMAKSKTVLEIRNTRVRKVSARLHSRLGPKSAHIRDVAWFLQPLASGSLLPPLS